MKKLILTSCVLATLASCSLGSFAAGAETPQETTLNTTETTTDYILGDVNGDGVISYKDFADLMHLYLNALSYIDDETYNDYDKRIEAYKNVLGLTDSQIKAADLENDGYFSPKSAILIMRYYLKKCCGYTKSFSPENFSEILNTDDLPESADKYFDLVFKNSEHINEYKTFEYYDTKAGDYNLDGKTDSKDAVDILKTYAESLANGNKSIPIEFDLAKFNADINNDNVIDSKDAVEILHTYAQGMAK